MLPHAELCRRPCRSAFAAAFLLAALAAAPAAFGEALTLGPGDIVGVSVLNRSELSGSYALRDDGTISMHLVGEIKAAGLTEAGLESVIETELAKATDLPASVTLAVTTWRPVYVQGDVQTPGAFPYVQGLTVEKAVALAGGLFRRDAAGASGIDLRLNDEGAKARWLETHLKELAVTRARLEAEASSELTFDYDAGGDQGLVAIIQEQKSIFDRRRASTIESTGAATRAQQMARAEAESLKQQQSLLEARIADQEEGVGKIRALFNKGLTSSERLSQEERNLNSDRIELMTASTYEARARQQMAQAEATITETETTRQRDIAAELAEIASQEREETLQLAASRKTLTEFGSASDLAAAAQVVGPPVFQVSRNGGDGVTLLELAPGDSLAPGDALDVSRLPVAAPVN